MKFPREIKGLSEDAYLYGMLLQTDVDLLIQYQKDAKKWELSWSNPMNQQYGDVQKAFEIVARLKEWKITEDEAIAMFEGTHLQTKELSVHELRKKLSKYIQEILDGEPT